MHFNTMKCRQVILLLTGFSASIAFSASQSVSQSVKNSLHSVFDIKQYRPAATFIVGPDFIKAGQAQNLTLLPPYQNHYTNNGNTQIAADVGGFLGIERVIAPWLITQL